MSTSSQPGFIVDSNVCTHALRNWKPAKTWWIEYEDRIMITDVVALELLRGTTSEQSRQRTSAFLGDLPTILTHRRHFRAAAECYRTWNRIASQRTPGLPDMMIAQVAIDHDMPLVTFNRKDFEHIPGLQIIADAYKAP